jgi:Glycosyl hydrolases family 18
MRYRHRTFAATLTGLTVAAFASGGLVGAAAEGTVAAGAAAEGTVAAGASATQVAPYMELSGPNPGNLQGALDVGLSSVTAAFVVGRTCTPIWDDGSTVARNKKAAKAIQGAQHAGAQVIISFGGAGGKELARSCTNLDDLTAAYQDVIDKFGVTQIDFDVEGRAIDPKAEKASIARRFAAIRALQQLNPDLDVSVTIGVGPSGLVSSGMKFLKVAKQSGTQIDLVNIMTMDYGGPVGDMGGTAIQAAQGTLVQVQSFWPKDTYANIGITPMIGDNDSAGETFTLADASEVVSFAGTNGVGRLAFWSVNRDQQCDALAAARNNCSGVAQDPLQFTSTFIGG